MILRRLAGFLGCLNGWTPTKTVHNFGARVPAASQYPFAVSSSIVSHDLGDLAVINALPVGCLEKRLLPLMIKGPSDGHFSTPERQNERSSSSATAISISCLDSFHHCESGNTPRAQTPKTRQETQSSFDQQCVHSWTLLSMNADEYLYCVLDDQKLGRSRSTHAVTHSALLP